MDFEGLSTWATTSTISQQLMAVMNSLGSRWTSRIENESICLAGIFGLSAQDLVIQDAITRMKRLFSMFQEVPAFLAFNLYSRIQDDSFRWIPTSLLDNSYNFTRLTVTDMPEAAYPTAAGLRLLRPGLDRLVIPELDPATRRKPNDTGKFEEDQFWIQCKAGYCTAELLSMENPDWELYRRDDLAIILNERIPDDS